jgi:hypothetical protein
MRIAVAAIVLSIAVSCHAAVIGETESPSEAGKPSPEQRAKWREDAQKLYATFAAAR